MKWDGSQEWLLAAVWRIDQLKTQGLAVVMVAPGRPSSAKQCGPGFLVCHDRDDLFLWNIDIMWKERDAYC